MYRRTVSIICVISILASLLCGMVFNVGAEDEGGSAGVRHRKLVSVVYDDSGSMMGPSWEYANYAMQCFEAMLDDQDLLSITFMSSPDRSVSVSLTDKNKAVTDIRDHGDSGGTPIGAVDTAFNTLKKYGDKDLNSEYWLVVLTDGAMGTKEDVEDKINAIADTDMPNGTKPNVIFVAMCDPMGLYTPNISKGNVQVKNSNNADEIVDVIFGVSGNISGKYKVDENDIKVIDSKTIEVNSDLPLMSISVLTQRTPAKVVSISGIENLALSEESNTMVAAPGKYRDNISDSDFAKMNGHMAIFKSTGNNIPAGKYTITFSEDVDVSNVIIMAEPAFELRLEVYANGIRVDDLTQLAAETVVTFEAKIYEFGTSNIIAESMLPGNAKKEIGYSEAQKTVATEPTLKIEDVTLKEVEYRVWASVDIEGYFCIRDEIVFTPMGIKIDNIVASIFYDGSPRRESGEEDENGNPILDGENVVYITDLLTSETGVKFTVYVDGAPIDKSTAASLLKRFEDGLEHDIKKVKVTVCDDGSFVVSPTRKGPAWWVNGTALVYSWIHSGEHEISDTLDGMTASETLVFKIGDLKKAVIDFIKLLIYIFIAIYIITLIFFKKRFSSCEIRVYKIREDGKERIEDSKELNFFSDSFWNCLLHCPARVKITDSYTFRATSGGGAELVNVKGLCIGDSEREAKKSDPCKKNTYKLISDVYVCSGRICKRITKRNV